MGKLISGTKIITFAKKYRYVMLVLLIGVLLMLWPNSKESAEQQSVILQAGADILSLEDKLEDILRTISGAGDVRVMLSVRTGEQVVYQTDESYDDSGSVEKADTVTVTDAERSQNGLVRMVIPPVYQGAIVVCEGADSPTVRLAVLEAVAKSTGLSSDRISVLKMK